jgi:hypothetical protein
MRASAAPADLQHWRCRPSDRLELIEPDVAVARPVPMAGRLSTMWTIGTMWTM